MKSRKYLFIHIGLPKCASSSLQIFFAINSRFLASNGIIYPEVFPLDQVRLQNYGQGNAYSLAYSMIDKSLKNITNCNLPSTNISDILESVPLTSNVLLSTEWFTILTKSALEKIRKEAHIRGFEAKIFFFYRNILSWAISEYNQAIKMGKIKNPTEFELTDPLHSIRLFEEVFGISNVKGIFLCDDLNIYKTSLNIMNIYKENYFTPIAIANQSFCDISLFVQMQAAKLSKPLSQTLLFRLDRFIRKYKLEDIRLQQIAPGQIQLIKYINKVRDQFCPHSIDKELFFNEIIAKSINDYSSREKTSILSIKLAEVFTNFIKTNDYKTVYREDIAYIFNSSLVNF